MEYLSAAATTGNMAPILIFLAAIAVVARSFKKYMFQRLHKLYKHYSYAASGKETEQPESDYCAVCLSQIWKREKVQSLPECNHRYHAGCIGAWLKNHNTCPLCRNKIIDDHIPHNQHKQVKSFRDSMIDLLQCFSDLPVALNYMMLPSSTSETFSLAH